MNKREFITLLGGSAAAWPLAVRAQQPGQVRRIGVLMARAANDPEGQKQAVALQRGIEELGWSPNRNVKIEISLAGRPEVRVRGAARNRPLVKFLRHWLIGSGCRTA